jgi:hypothetical protein
MPDIMIRCPIYGRAVPTGLTTEKIKFASLSDITIPFRCPDCLRIHKWEQKDAWVDEGAETDQQREVAKRERQSSESSGSTKC